MERYFNELAAAFVRGRLGNCLATIYDWPAAGMRLHRTESEPEWLFYA